MVGQRECTPFSFPKNQPQCPHYHFHGAVLQGHGNHEAFRGVVPTSEKPLGPPPTRAPWPALSPRSAETELPLSSAAWPLILPQS